MRIQLSSFSYLFLLLSITLIHILQSSLVNAAAVKSSQSEEVEEDTRPECNTNEPCKYVTMRPNSSTSMLEITNIPSWCRCGPEQRCRKLRYDRRKKVNVHVCKDKKRSKKLRHQNRSHISFFL